MKRSSKRRRMPGKLTLGELRAAGLDPAEMPGADGNYARRGNRHGRPYGAHSKCVAPCHRYVPTSSFKPLAK